MKTSEYAVRIYEILYTAMKAGDGEIKLPHDLSKYVVNEMGCLADDVRQMENCTIPPHVRDMPAPTGVNVVDFAGYKNSNTKKRNVK